MIEWDDWMRSCLGGLNCLLSGQLLQMVRRYNAAIREIEKKTTVPFCVRQIFNCERRLLENKKKKNQHFALFWVI